MEKLKTENFSAKIEQIGINPFVYVPNEVLEAIFLQANKNKGKIPVKIKIEGHEFPQTLIKYAGYWRLYLNTPMRKAAKKETGDTASFEIRYDPEKRVIAPHPKFLVALNGNEEAKKKFESLPPSRQSEIIKYLSFLKTEESIDRNIARAVGFLMGKERFIGRDEP